MSGRLSPNVLDDVRLLVSELVTNSIRHARLAPSQWVDLAVRIEGDTVRVEVIDPGPGFRPSVLRPTLYQESGWGLYLVEQVAKTGTAAQIAERQQQWQGSRPCR